MMGHNGFRLTGHNALRLHGSLGKSFESRSHCMKENAWLRSLVGETAEERKLLWDRKTLVREARDMAPNR